MSVLVDDHDDVLEALFIEHMSLIKTVVRGTVWSTPLTVCRSVSLQEQIEINYEDMIR